MPLRNYLRIVTSVATILVFLYLIEGKNGWKPGLFVGGMEILAELFSIYIISQSSYISKSHKYSLLFSFLLLAVADTAYVSFYYYFNFSDQLTWTIALTTVQYALAFFFICAVIVGAIERSEIKNFFFNPVSILTAAVVSTIALQFLVKPYIQLVSGNGISFLALAQGLTIVSSFALVYVSLLAFLSSRSLFWTIFSAGAFILGLGDWAIRVETLLGRTVQFGFYEFFWASGVGLICAPILMFRSSHQTISSFRVNSLLSTYKLGTLVAILAFVGFLFVSGVFSLGSLKIAVLACALTVLLSGYVALFILEQTERFVRDTLSVLDDSNEPTNMKNVSEKLPIELKSTFEVIHQEKVAQRLKDTQHKYDLEVALAKSDLAKKVAHDIRSPLSALKILAEGLDSVSKEEKIILQLVTSRIDQISEDLLNKNQFHTYQQRLKKRIYLLNSIDSLLMEKKFEFKNRTNVSISMVPDPELSGLEVYANEADLHRTLSNLINNSLEAITEDGRIEVKVGRDGLNALISVQDTGTGLTKTQLIDIGLKNRFTSKTLGHGHGLTQVYSFLRNHDGHLAVTSQLGQGSTFVIRIPIFNENNEIFNSVKLDGSQLSVRNIRTLPSNQ